MVKIERIEKGATFSAPLKVLLWGDTGVGKTPSALSFPNPLVIDLENGVLPYAGSYEFGRFATAKMSEIRGLIAEIKQGKHTEYETLIVDSGTMLRQVLQSQYSKIVTDRKRGKPNSISNADLDEALTVKEHGQINAAMSALWNSIILLPIHVVVIARLANEYEEGTGANLKVIGQKPDLDKNAPYSFDLSFRMNKNGQHEIVRNRGDDENGKKKKVIKIPARPTWDNFYSQFWRNAGETQEFVDVDRAAQEEAASVIEESTPLNDRKAALFNEMLGLFESDAALRAAIAQVISQGTTFEANPAAFKAAVLQLA